MNRAKELEKEIPEDPELPQATRSRLRLLALRYRMSSMRMTADEFFADKGEPIGIRFDYLRIRYLFSFFGPT